jgi:hypothetical protein
MERRRLEAVRNARVQAVATIEDLLEEQCSWSPRCRVDPVYLMA